MAQSSVDWLMDKLKFIDKNAYNELYEDYEQAKAMRKEEVKNAYITGIMHPLETEATKQAEEYYNETYGNENTQTRNS